MTIEADSVKLFGKMSESFGPSGFENETAGIVKEAAAGLADQVRKDKLGSLIFTHRGSEESPNVLLAGHMDEVGFVVTGVDEKSGFLTFNPLGGWFDQVLLGQRVRIRTAAGDVVGVIASKPPHLLPPEEREKVVKLSQMYIDVGATSGQEVKEHYGIRIGDPAAPLAPFLLTKAGTVAIGKAFDDRIGTFAGIEVLRRLKQQGIRHPNAVHLAATVQEEVGLRGAQTVAHVVDPDVAIVLEADIAGDVPGIKPHEAPAKMGGGPSILTYDSSMIPNQPLKKFIIGVAEDAGIAYQLSSVSRGGTDAGRFHLNRGGCPSIAIGIPTRHIHSHSAIASLGDIDATVSLAVELLKRLDSKTVESFT